MKKQILKIIGMIGTMVISISVGCQKETTPFIDVTDIDISLKTAELMKGNVLQLKAVVVPSNSTMNEIEWVSSDESILNVNEEGLVIAIDVGSAVILARHEGIVAECMIRVLPVPVSGISIEGEDVIEMNISDSHQLLVTLSPDNVDNKDIVFSSSDKNVASVNASGLIMALRSGEAVIKATCGEFVDSISVYATGKPQIGDIFYSDGTYYTVPVSGKKPIGIIFYIGDPTKDDIALKQDHPECTHGLVCTIDFESSSEWQTERSKYGKLVSDWQRNNPEAAKYIDVSQTSGGEYLNAIMGYNNTKVYQMFNADEANSAWPINAMNVIERVKEKIPLPENTSGWYCPSAKELSLMCTGQYDENIGTMPEPMGDPLNAMETLLNERLFKIPGAYLFSPTYYISSTEDKIVKQMYSTTYTQWHIKMQSGYIFSQDKGFTPQAIRPVFAF